MTPRSVQSRSTDRRAPAAFSLRTDVRPGDLGRIVSLHGTLYAREYGFDATFEAFVAKPLAEFVLSHSARERLWIAERRGEFAGCIAIVTHSPRVAQLRWFLVDPSARGSGLGRRLLDETIPFCKDAGYRSIMLYTLGALEAAGHLYRAAGFRIRTRKNGRRWGVKVIEEVYDLDLIPPVKPVRRRRAARATPK